MTSYYELISRNAAIAPKSNMMEYQVHHHAMKWKAIGGVEAGTKRELVSTLLDAVHDQVTKSLRTAITEKRVPHDKQVAQLKSAALKFKRKVVDTMAIIPTPAAAAYLGIPEARLREMKYNAMFGDVYMGRQCFSMDELALLAMNPGWVKYYTPEASAEQIVLPNPAALDAMTFVDEELACAYTDLAIYNLAKQAKPSLRRYGTYNIKHQFRLSDLEKIRVAKLIASH